MTLQIPVCSECGSHNVFADAYSTWDVANQEWSIVTTFDSTDCGDCGGECSIEWIPAPPEPAESPSPPVTLAEAKALSEISKDKAYIVEWNVPIYIFLDENNRLMYVVKTTNNTYAKKEYDLCLNSI